MAGKNTTDLFKIENFNRLYNKYKLLALNMFTWENLPETCESRYIENALYENGLCLFVNDNTLGFITVPCNYTAKMNVNGEAIEVNTSGYNYAKKFDLIKNKECEIIRNNDLALNTHDVVFNYAERMLEVEMCIRANINQQKFPYFINATEKTKKSLEIIFKKVDNFEPFILANKELELMNGGLDVLTTTVPFVADKLNDYKYELEREILTYFSLNNTIEKKERMIVDEVNSNNDYISTNAMLMYKTRLDACEKINKKFGLNIKVSLNKDLIKKYVNDDIDNTEVDN